MNMPSPNMLFVIIGLLFGLSVTLGWRISIAHKRIDVVHKRISMNSQRNGLIDTWDEEEPRP